MSKRSYFISQHNSPNILILPTETCSTTKKSKFVTDESNKHIQICERPPVNTEPNQNSQIVHPGTESAFESPKDPVVSNKPAIVVTDSNSNDLAQITTDTRPKTVLLDPNNSNACAQYSPSGMKQANPSWASNYLSSIGEVYKKPIRLNLSSRKNKSAEDTLHNNGLNTQMDGKIKTTNPTPFVDQSKTYEKSNRLNKANLNNSQTVIETKKRKPELVNFNVNINCHVKSHSTIKINSYQTENFNMINVPDIPNSHLHSASVIKLHGDQKMQASNRVSRNFYEYASDCKKDLKSESISKIFKSSSKISHDSINTNKHINSDKCTKARSEKSSNISRDVYKSHKEQLANTKTDQKAINLEKSTKSYKYSHKNDKNICSKFISKLNESKSCPIECKIQKVHKSKLKTLPITRRSPEINKPTNTNKIKTKTTRISPENDKLTNKSKIKTKTTPISPEIEKITNKSKIKTKTTRISPEIDKITNKNKIKTKTTLISPEIDKLTNKSKINTQTKNIISAEVNKTMNMNKIKTQTKTRISPIRTPSCSDTGDSFSQNLYESTQSTSIKSVVTVPKNFEFINSTNQLQNDVDYDLRAKLCRRNRGELDFSTCNKNIHSRKNTEKVKKEERDNLLISIDNEIEDDGKSKEKDKTSNKIKKTKNPTIIKYKKIKLIINLIHQKQRASSSEVHEEQPEDSKNCTSSDISFLDDFNVDEIVESLNDCDNKSNLANYPVKCDDLSAKGNFNSDETYSLSTSNNNKKEDIDSIRSTLVVKPGETAMNDYVTALNKTIDIKQEVLEQPQLQNINEQNCITNKSNFFSSSLENTSKSKESEFHNPLLANIKIESDVATDNEIVFGVPPYENINKLNISTISQNDIGQTATRILNEISLPPIITDIKTEPDEPEEEPLIVQDKNGSIAEKTKDEYLLKDAHKNEIGKYCAKVGDKKFGDVVVKDNNISLQDNGYNLLHADKHLLKTVSSSQKNDIIDKLMKKATPISDNNLSYEDCDSSKNFEAISKILKIQTKDLLIPENDLSKSISNAGLKSEPKNNIKLEIDPTTIKLADSNDLIATLKSSDTTLEFYRDLKVENDLSVIIDNNLLASLKTTEIQLNSAQKLQMVQNNNLSEGLNKASNSNAMESINSVTDNKKSISNNVEKALLQFSQNSQAKAEFIISDNKASEKKNNEVINSSARASIDNINSTNANEEPVIKISGEKTLLKSCRESQAEIKNIFDNNLSDKSNKENKTLFDNKNSTKDNEPNNKISVENLNIECNEDEASPISGNETVAKSTTNNKKAKNLVSQKETKVSSSPRPESPPLETRMVKAIESRMLQFLRQKYTVTSLLHNGKYSKIFSCKNVNGANYALKLLSSDRNESYKSQFLKTKMLRHIQQDVPRDNLNLINILNGFSVIGYWCFLMEYYPKTLKQALEENKKSFHIDKVQYLSRQLVSAVTLLRNNNVVHSDIMPTHILLNSSNERLKLCGFDECRNVNSTIVLPNIGTVQYRAPEIILGYSAGFSIDVWSTALVMYEMATNTQLFPGSYNNDILFKQMCTLGNISYDMISQSLFKNNHFLGTTFMRRVGFKGSQKIYFEKFFRSQRIRKTILNSYGNDWCTFRTRRQRLVDKNKLSCFHQLIERMLCLQPESRIGIEFVYASPFLMNSFSNDVS